MPNLREQLRQCLTGSFCLMGIGNPDYGDDGFGVRLAEKLEEEGMAGVIIAGTDPERYIGKVADSGCDNLLFLDAVDFGGAPGSVILLNSGEIAARFPQVSTHKISLGLMAKWVEDSGRTNASLLGVQPESLKTSAELTPTMQTTLEALRELICGLRHEGNKDFTASSHDNQECPESPRPKAPNNEVTV